MSWRLQINAVNKVDRQQLKAESVQLLINGKNWAILLRMVNADWIKKIVGAIIGAAVGIPSVAAGFYSIYEIVTLLGN